MSGFLPNLVTFRWKHVSAVDLSLIPLFLPRKVRHLELSYDLTIDTQHYENERDAQLVLLGVFITNYVVSRKIILHSLSIQVPACTVSLRAYGQPSGAFARNFESVCRQAVRAQPELTSLDTDFGSPEPEFFNLAFIQNDLPMLQSTLTHITLELRIPPTFGSLTFNKLESIRLILRLPDDSNDLTNFLGAISAPALRIVTTEYGTSPMDERVPQVRIVDDPFLDYRAYVNPYLPSFRAMLHSPFFKQVTHFTLKVYTAHIQANLDHGQRNFIMTGRAAQEIEWELVEALCKLPPPNLESLEIVATRFGFGSLHLTQYIPQAFPNLQVLKMITPSWVRSILDHSLPVLKEDDIHKFALNMPRLHTLWVPIKGYGHLDFGEEKLDLPPCYTLRVLNVLDSFSWRLNNKKQKEAAASLRKAFPFLEALNVLPKSLYEQEWKNIDRHLHALHQGRLEKIREFCKQHWPA